jgi:hypothetical protein
MSCPPEIVVSWHKNSNDTNGQVVLSGFQDDTGLVDFEALGTAVLNAVDSVVGIDTQSGTVYSVSQSSL